MKIEVIKSHTFKKNTWSGGTTTQFFIYPYSADYTKLNFDFRLSMATVAIEKSIFSSLPGVSRKLMVLEGEIILDHENRYQKKLCRFDIDEFEGDWKTSSVGTCTDFNLMTKGEITGELVAFESKQDESLEYPVEKNLKYLFIYIYSGKSKIDINNTLYMIEQGDLLVINTPSVMHIQSIAIKDTTLVFSKIMNKNKYEPI